MNYPNKDPNKEALYLDNIRRSLTEIYDRIEVLSAGLEEDADEEDLTPEQVFAVQAIEAVEQEWVLDPEMRSEMSVIQWDDD